MNVGRPFFITNQWWRGLVSWDSRLIPPSAWGATQRLSPGRRGVGSVSPEGNSGSSHLCRPFRALPQFTLVPRGSRPGLICSALSGPITVYLRSVRIMASTQPHLAQMPPRSGGTGQPRAQALGNLNDLNQSPERAKQPALVNIRRLRVPMARLQGGGFPPSLKGTLIHSDRGAVPPGRREASWSCHLSPSSSPRSGL